MDDINMLHINIVLVINCNNLNLINVNTPHVNIHITPKPNKITDLI